MAGQVAGGRPTVVFEYPIGPTMTVSFQRYEAPTTGAIRSLPSSLGALPMALNGDHALLAVPDGEAYWIGLVPTRGAIPTTFAATAELASGERFDLLTGLTFDDRPQLITRVWHAIIGFPNGDRSWLALGTSCLVRSIDFHGSARIGPTGRVVVITADAFRELTGHPVAPLDRSGGYDGRLLP